MTTYASPDSPERPLSARQALMEQRLRRRARPDTPAVISRRDEGVNPPLSVGQERLWLLHQLDPDDIAFSMVMARRWRGPIDPDVLQRALDALVARHEILRTRFPSEDGDPLQVVEPPSTVPVAHIDVAGADDPEQEARRRVSAAPFDLADGPLLRVSLLRLADADHVLVVTCHHIIADGVSCDILLSELERLYTAFVTGTPYPLAPLPVQYADFAIWQRRRLDGPFGAADLAYWTAQLADAPVLDLPTDRPRGPVRSSAGDAVTIQLDRELTERIERLAATQRCTLFMTLLAAFQAVLARHTGQDDVCVGSPIAGRDLMETEPLIGYFINTLVLRADLSGDPTFRDVLSRTRATVLDAFTHQDIPFERVMAELDVERDLSRPPLFQTLFVMHTERDAGTAVDQCIPGVELTDFDTWNPAAKFELCFDGWRGPDGITAKFTYATDLFDRESVERVAERFRMLLAAVTTDPDQRLSAIDLISRDERSVLLAGGATADRGNAAAETVPELIAAQIDATPTAVAVRCGAAVQTYEELGARADRIAAALIATGTRRGDLVGVCLDRSIDLAAALLGVWRAGAAYLPLDPDYPRDRLAFLLADSGASTVLTRTDLRGRIPEPDGTTGPLLVCLDDHLVADPPAGASPAGARGSGDAGEPAYVIYTSGSTGRPKGALVSHRALAARVAWMRDAYGITPADRVLQFASVSFDTHAEEFFPCLTSGAALVMLPDGGAFLPDFLASPHGRDITVLDLPTPFWHQLVADLDVIEWPPELRLTIIGADQAQSGAVAAWIAHFGERVRLVNTYGPTETTIIATAAELTGSDGVPPIGTPIAATTCYVLDDRQRLVPPGVPGELCIGGSGLADHYLGRAALTAERFVPDPFGPPGGRLYRTGDRVRRRRDGQLEFLGRLDDQVKIRGYRIEPGEIQACLVDHPDVGQAAVVVRAGELVGYVVPVRSGAPADHDALLRDLDRHLTTALPAHMVPGAVAVLERLPLTPNGKLDRRALPEPRRLRDEQRAYAAPEDETQDVMAQIWADVLGVQRVGIDDDFFALGGHSLLAAQVIARTRRALGPGISLMDLFQRPTVRMLAAGTTAADTGPAGRRLLYELTRPTAAAPAVTYVCVPYGGGSPVVYQPLADRLPAGQRLFSVAIPGHDIGLDEQPLPFDELASAVTAEILERVDGPLVIYGQSSVGSALTVEVARRLENTGRSLEAVYIGAAFPFARPASRLGATVAKINRFLMGSDRSYSNWLASMGVDLSDVEPAQARHIVRTMRRDGQAAEEYFTGLLAEPQSRLRAPLISVVGERDPATEFYQERFREWHFLADRTALVVVDEAGHFFPKYRADELAEIVTRTHHHLDRPEALGSTARGPDPDWWLAAVSRAGGQVNPPGPQPGLGRFSAVAVSQLVAMFGAALTEFAVPIWILTETGSIADFAMFLLFALVPGMLAAPLAGAVVDRYSRRRVMMLGSLAAGATQLVLGTLVWTGSLQIWHIYALLISLSVALSFQRLAYTSAVPQLVPKQLLGHANGVGQMLVGLTQLLVPLIAVGLLAGVGLGGILLLDVLGYVIAILVVGLVRFPATMPHRRREGVLAEIRGGLTYAWGNRGIRYMLLFFAGLNVFLGPMFMLTSPLVLSFADLAQVGQVAFAAGGGAVVGGLAMVLWGGPRVHRMRGMLACTLVLAGFCAVPGLRADLGVVVVGAFGMSLWLTVVNGIYTTIVQVKVPQRFHGRVFALNHLIAWSTLPIGFIVVVPHGSALFEALMADDGPLASTAGAVLGTGVGRGIALMYLVFALAMAGYVLTVRRMRAFARFDSEVPEAVPDDLVGWRERRRRAAALLVAAPVDRPGPQRAEEAVR